MVTVRRIVIGKCTWMYSVKLILTAGERHWFATHVALPQNFSIITLNVFAVLSLLIFLYSNWILSKFSYCNYFVCVCCLCFSIHVCCKLTGLKLTPLAEINFV